jgi:hypothetical protein
MSGITIASIVEGDGEVRALPVLLRRIAQELQVWNIEVPTPYRMSRGKIVMAGGLENVVQAQAYRVADAGGVLVLLDADDDCPASLGPMLHERAVAARPDVPVAVVLANREYEAWFLASAASLAGHRGLSDPLEAPQDPERIRGAKEWLRRIGHCTYSPTTDQAALTARFDLKVARQNSPSFDKLWREVERLIRTPA